MACMPTDLTQAKEAAAAIGGKHDAHDVQCLATLLAFLREDPGALSWRGKRRPVLTTSVGRIEVARRYLAARRKPVVPSTPSTTPDPIVSEVLETYYSYPTRDRARLQKEHRDSMAAENTVGALLERYIASIVEPLGWVWCAGDCVTAVDFIKSADGGWATLQVKNRDNSENSSSSKVRVGTQIKKWHRSKSRSSETNWRNFPDLEAARLLSEHGFIQFVRGNLRRPQ